MDFNQLEEELNALWDGIIEKMDFDILGHTIRLNTKAVIDDKTTKRYTIVFSGVSSFYFIENTGTERFNLSQPSPGDFLELSMVVYYKKGVGKIGINPDKTWTEQWHSSANFALELWSSILFIEAHSVTINHRTFDVGYPPS